jgi:hypothetical protein
MKTIHQKNTLFVIQNLFRYCLIAINTRYLNLKCENYFVEIISEDKKCPWFFPKIPDWRPGARTANATVLCH